MADLPPHKDVTIFRSYLPGLGLSAAVVAAVLAIYAFFGDDLAGRNDDGARGRSGAAGAGEVQLPRVPGTGAGAREPGGSGGGGGAGGAAAPKKGS